MRGGNEKARDNSPSHVLALHPSNRPIALEHFLIAFEAERRADRASAESMGEHLPSLEQDETRVMSKRSGYVVNLHPALSFPAHELHFLGRQVLRAHHCRGAVVFL